MTGIDFPSNPSVNQQFSAFGNVWVWNGSSWRKVSRTAVLLTFLQDDPFQTQTLPNAENC